MARPRANLGQPIYVRLPPDADQAIRQIAEREDREISEVVRLAVKDYVSRRAHGPALRPNGRARRRLRPERATA